MRKMKIEMMPKKFLKLIPLTSNRSFPAILTSSYAMKWGKNFFKGGGGGVEFNKKSDFRR